MSYDFFLGFDDVDDLLNRIPIHIKCKIFKTLFDEIASIETNYDTRKATIFYGNECVSYDCKKRCENPFIDFNIYEEIGEFEWYRNGEDEKYDGQLELLIGLKGDLEKTLNIINKKIELVKRVPSE